MNAAVTLQTRVADYLAERRRLGYHLRSTALTLRSFARYVDGLDLSAPLKVEVMATWARQAKTNSDNPTTWARRLERLRPFTRWLQQFDPGTEVPDSTVFGPIGWRPAPHIFTEPEIADVGLAEAEAFASGRKIRVTKVPFSATARPQGMFLAPGICPPRSAPS